MKPNWAGAYDSEMESRKKFEGYVVYTVAVLTILLFVLMPKYADGAFAVWLNGFLDNYLFGNGYYKPTAYPFASKVTNSLSVVMTVIAAAWMGIFRKNDVTFSISKIRLFWYWLIIIFLMLFCFHLSMYPRYFATTPPRRSFGLTESFHNNPFLFMFMMFMKNMMIYTGVRTLVTFPLYFLSKNRKRV